MTHAPRPFILEEADLRDRLVRFREEELMPRFGHVPRERGLLRRQMIDALVRHRPQTGREFIGLLPRHLLRQTDPEQLAFGLQVVSLITGRPAIVDAPRRRIA